MVRNEKTHNSFSGQEATYFEWSRTNPPPPKWINVEKPALIEGLNKSLYYFSGKLTFANARILDVGVGAGKVLDLLKELGAPATNLTAIDNNPAFLELVQKIHPDVALRQADITSPTVLEILADRGPFHIITCHMVLNHLDDQAVRSALDQIYKLLIDNCMLVALIPHPDNPEKSLDLHDSETGYYTEDEGPWGGQTDLRYRSSVYWFELMTRMPFFPSFISRGSVVNHTNPMQRMLITCWKNSLMEQTLHEMEITHHQFPPRWLKGKVR